MRGDENLKGLFFSAQETQQNMLCAARNQNLLKVSAPRFHDLERSLNDAAQIGAQWRDIRIIDAYLRDGRAIHHSFANRRTAMAHRNGIRQAIGQDPAPA